MSGIFEALGTPAQRQEVAIRKNLEARRAKWTPKPGELYRGAGDLLLRHGRFFAGRALPGEYQHLFRRDSSSGEGNCFRNAWVAARDSGLPYFEGVYAVGSGHYTPHAWVVALDGGLLEVSFPTDAETLARAARANVPNLKLLPPEHWGYWGVELHPEYVQRISEIDNSYGGTLDRPIHDEIFKEKEWMDMTEEREHFPIFTYKYDPDRREP